MSHLPLAAWALGLLVLWMVRRDRRLVVRGPRRGAAVVATFYGGYLIWRIFCVPHPLGWLDEFCLFGLPLLGSMLALPALVTWICATGMRDLPRLARHARQSAGWLVPCAVLASVAGAGYFAFGRQLESRGVLSRYEILFEADPIRYQDPYELAHSNTTHKHPLLPILWYAGKESTSAFFGQRWGPLVLSCVLGGACVFLAALYFHAITRSAVLAVLGAALLGVTSAHFVFGALPESAMPIAAALILLHLGVAHAQRPSMRLRHHVLAGVLAAGVLITNAFTALICFPFLRRAPRGAAFGRWLCAVFLLGMVGVVFQNLALPEIVINPGLYGLEEHYVAPGLSSRQRAANLATGLLLHNVVGPPPRVESDTGWIRTGAYTDSVSRVAVGVWALAGLFGVAGILRARAWRRPTFRAALACLAFVAAIHAVYGNASLFLYSCSFTFLVVAVLLHGYAGLPRGLATGLLIVTVAALAWNDMHLGARILALLDETAALRAD